MTRLDRDLDRALSGRSESDSELVGLVETARALTQAFDLEPEPASRERALFAAAVGARGRSGFPLVRLLAPVAAGLGLVAALGFASGSAMPGDVLYPVRKVLQGVGLNEGVLEDAVARMDQAEALLDEAEDLVGGRNGRATTLAVKAIQVLAPVDGLLQETDLSSEVLAGHRSRLAALIERGTSVIARTEEGSQKDDDQMGADGSRGEGEHDGPSGSDDDDDSSGPGSGDGDGDDSSGSDSDDGDDRSGSGNGDGDDRSGSGDGDGDDRSGSGDGDGDGSSGSDSDDEDDRSGAGDEEDRSGSDRDPIDSLDDSELDDSGPDAEDSLD